MILKYSPPKSLLKLTSLLGSFVLLVFCLPAHAYEENSTADYAQDLQNPVADLMNFQPVIPIDLNDDAFVISRTIMPLVRVEDVFPNGNRDGLGDIVQSFFYSPKASTESGWIWGVGPALLFPTATEDELGQEKWAAGPTAVALK